MDAAFLYFETPTTHMHVAMTAVFDPSSMPGGYDFATVRDFIASRLHLVPPFRRRVVQVPFRLNHPIWVEDPDFDLDYHIRRVGVPSPGGARELAELAGAIAGVPLDRSRPLWELYVVEGLADGTIAVITKVHHCAVDGVSGAELMVNLFDLEPTGREVEPPEPREPEPIPSELELIGHAVASRARRQLGLLPLLGTTAKTLTTLVSRHRDPNAIVGAVPLTAPKTPWNAAITPHRRMAYTDVPLSEVKRIKNAVGCTVNDVVLGLMGGALRRYLERHGGNPQEPLIATCPVSVRTDEQRGETNNRVSAMFTSLATNVDDPVERLRTIQRSTKGAKEDHNAIGASFLQDWAEHAAPTTFALAARLYSSLGLASGHRPIHNVVISNVPGPPFPLYYAGAELLHALPMGPVMEGAGLNITVMSYRENLDIGFMACRELVPDVWDLVDHVHEALAELSAAADRLEADAAPPAAAKKARARRAATPREPRPKGAAAKGAGGTKAAPRKAAAKRSSATGRGVAAPKAPRRRTVRRTSGDGPALATA